MRVVSFGCWVVLIAACVLSACASSGQTGTAQGGGGGGGSTPTITSFSATPSTLPVGGGSVSLSWAVDQADTITIDHGIGTVMGQSLNVNVTATTVYLLTATNANGATTKSATVAVAGGGGGTGSGRFVSMIAPVGGESFTAPANLRLVAAAYDPNVFINTPTAGHGGNASNVQFFVDDTMVLEQDGLDAEYNIFKGFTAGVGVGSHRVWARAFYTNPVQVLDSVPVIVTVDAAPAYAQTVELTGDFVITGATQEWIGSPGGRIRVNGNGYRIIGSGSTAVTWKYIDFYNLGGALGTATPSIDITTTGAVGIEGCTFDYSNYMNLSFGDTATATINNNVFRSNMRQPIGQQPYPETSYPVLYLKGASIGAKTFTRNNVGAGWIHLTSSASNWTIGGDNAAMGNVFIGPRVGVEVDVSARNIDIKHNYSHHIYRGGWSQGSNFELGGVSSLTAEHNVVAGSSWPVRGVGGEFRYNLVLDAGHQWLWADKSNGFIHHNVFIGGDADVGGILVLYETTGVRIQNNTIDGMNGSSIAAAVKQTAGSTTVTSNLFLNVPLSPVSVMGGTMVADYNLFWNSAAPSYSDGRTPANDIHADPKLANPATNLYDFDEVALWKRTLAVHDVLAQYRAKYTPTAGSPAIDTGDPVLGAGNDIGAVGAGIANPADKFGK